MLDPTQFHPRMSVEELLTIHPRAAEAFIDRRMACVGCPIAPFETIEEVVRIYGEDTQRFLESVRLCAGENEDDTNRG